MSRLFDDAIASGVGTGLKKAAPGIVDVVLNSLWDHPWFPFIVGAQVRLIETGMKPREAWDLARKVLVEHVRDEGVEYGDTRYRWGPAGGREVIEACEIEYWDAPA